MKNNIVTIVFLLGIGLVFSQELKIKFSVNSFIYQGFDAPIEIIGCVNSDQLEVTSKDVEVKKYERNKYTLKAMKPGVVHLEIYNKNTKTSQTIPVAVLPLKPKAFLNRGGYMTTNVKRALRYSTGLKTKVFEIGPITVFGKILFDATIIHNNQVFRFKDEKRRFSQNILSLFKILEKGDLVVFNNIRFKPENEQELLLDDLVFEIN